jgi:porin
MTKDFLTLSGGWVNPYDIFAQQRNRSFSEQWDRQQQGNQRERCWLVHRDMPRGADTWRSNLVNGTTRRPDFFSPPNANNTANHGLDFQDARPADRNGLYFIAETAVTPQIGRSQLPGKYVFGGYYWGIENTSFFGEPFDGKFGFYWQAHQMLSCEPSPYVVEETSGDAKTSPNVAFYGKLEISETEGIAHETPQKAGG